MVGFGDGRFGGGGEAAELGGQVVELLAEVGGTLGWLASGQIISFELDRTYESSLPSDCSNASTPSRI